MRKVTSYLFISLDGVVEAPDTFVRSDLYEDFDPLTAEMIAEQDAVLLGAQDVRRLVGILAPVYDRAVCDFH